MQDDETRARVQTIYASVDFERLRQAIRKEIGRKRLQLRDDRDLFAGKETHLKCVSYITRVASHRHSRSHHTHLIALPKPNNQPQT